MAKRHKFEYAKNASKLHRLVGDTLRSSNVFSGYDIYQEYPGSKVNSKLSDRFHFDWAIPRLRLVIECHGEQHYRPVCFGGVDYEVAIDNFYQTKRRDTLKKDAALYGGWVYLEIPYHTVITEDKLFSMYILAKEEAESYNEVTDTVVPKPEKTEYHKTQLERAKQHRKERYQRQKEWKKKHGS